MPQCCLGFDAPLGVPNQTFGDEVDELFVVASENLGKCLGPRSPPSTFGVNHCTRGPVGIEKKLLSRATVNKLLVRGTEDLHDTGQLLLFVLSRKYGETCVQFRQNATQTPHINCHVIIHTKNYFRRSIEPTLNISIDFLVFETTATKVNDLDGAFGRMAQ